ncbi:alpha/beta hydrolase [Aquibacillus saliphilus]|uniref:alpha/beta hydrolase n=1 Tax=Aquibacillus saliphilus TaxID=1909422 RepID=UPI001CF0019E
MPIKLWEDNVPSQINVEDSPTITPYLVDTDGVKTSAVIICPGGAYARKADHEGEPVAKWLNSLGISAFVLDYRVAPNKYPSSLQDVKRAIRYVRAHAIDWAIDQDRIGILGFSAGGHLASTAGTQYDFGDPKAKDPVERISSRPDLMILCYPVITMMKPYCHQGSVSNLLGENPSADLIESLSNHLHINKDTPPTFLWHTADDQSVPVENSFMFASALRQHQIPFDLHVFEQGVHGLGLADENQHVRSWQSQCLLWLQKHNFA